MSEYCEEKMCDGCKIEADCPGFAPLDEIHTCDESCEEGGCPMITEGALPASDIPEIADCKPEEDTIDDSISKILTDMGVADPDAKAPVVDPTLEFDISREARKNALTTAVKLLDREGKVTPKQLVPALKNVTNHAIYLDELAVSLLQEMYKVAQLLAQREVDMFNMQASMRAIILGLSKKGVLTEDELSEIFSKEVLPVMFKKEEE